MRENRRRFVLSTRNSLCVSALASAFAQTFSGEFCSKPQTRVFVCSCTDADALVAATVVALTRSFVVGLVNADACIVEQSIANTQNATPSQRGRLRCIKA